MDILSQSGDDSSVVLRCLIRQLAPFSPQTAPRQAQLFHQYVQILQRHQFKLQNAPIMPINTEFGIITSGGLANLEWAKPFVDLATVATFPGLALSKLAYGITSDENGQNPQNQTQLQTFARPSAAGQEQSEQLDLLVPDDPSHAVFPSKTCHLFVWEELQQITMDVLNKESPHGKSYSHFGLFSNQFTNNGNSSPLPSDEPFSVRLGFQNPFPFPLVLRNLCLSLDQLKLRHGCSPPFSDKFRCSIISELAISPLITNERTSAEIVLKKQFVDLHVLPGPELEHFAVNGIKFDLCSPSANDENGQSVEIASISAFFPLSVRGKRLFKSKEQRMTKEFAVDKRLSAAICSFPVPLLSFRPIGGDPGFIKAVTHWHPLEAFCDQIVQIVFEIENIGRIDVEQLRFCTNFAEQVSISEPSGSGESIGRWTQCSAKVMSTAFTDDSSMAGEFGMDAAIVGQFGKVSKDSPLRVSGKIGLRVAIRVQQKPQNFYFLFLYIDQNGSSRQFRFAARVRPLSRIFDADHCVLNETIGLSMLKLRCLPLNSRESDAKAKRTLTKLDLLRLSVKSSDGKVREKVRRVDNEPIQLENATEQNLCFYISNEAAEGQGMAPATEPMPNFRGWTDVWLGKTYVPDFPEWQKAERRVDRKPALIGDEQQTETLQMKLLWKASVIRGDGTVSNVFGEFVKQIEPRSNKHTV